MHVLNFRLLMCCVLSHHHREDCHSRNHLRSFVGTLMQGLNWCAAAAVAADRASLAAAITAASADAHLRAGEHDLAAAVLQVQTASGAFNFGGIWSTLHGHYAAAFCPEMLGPERQCSSGGHAQPCGAGGPVWRHQHRCSARRGGACNAAAPIGSVCGGGSRGAAGARCLCDIMAQAAGSEGLSFSRQRAHDPAKGVSPPHRQAMRQQHDGTARRLWRGTQTAKRHTSTSGGCLIRRCLCG